MADRADKSPPRTRSFRAAAIVFVLAVAVLALPFILWPYLFPATPLTNNVREEVLALLAGSVKVGPEDQLEWAPAVDFAYDLGSVFLPSERLFRFSDSCDQVRSIDSGSGMTLEISKKLDLNPSGTFSPLLTSRAASDPKVEAEIKTAAQIDYSFKTHSAEVIASKKALLKDLFSDADCLADIADRKVVVLAARVIGEEEYLIQRKFISKVTATLGDFFGGGGESGQSQSNRVADIKPRTLIWAFTEVELSEPRVPADAPDDYRARAAKSLLTTESDYVSIALRNVKLSKPSPDVIEKMLLLSREN